MFSFFFFKLISSYHQTQYDLVPPLINTDVNEIGNWTIRGTATNLKNSIRLTSIIPGSFGSICQRVPTLFKEWILEMEILANGNNENPGHGIWFFYTKEVCPAFAYKFNGFSFWINTSATDRKGNSPVYFVKGNGSDMIINDLKPVGHVNCRDKSKPLRVKITRKGGMLTVDATKDVIFERIVNEKIDGTPDYGYFSVSAVTTSKTDNNNLMSFRVYSLSDVDHPNKTFDFSTTNKKYIENDKERRKEMKRRRRSKMQNMQKYLNEANESNKILNANTEQDMKDAIHILAEAIRRSKKSMSEGDLAEFILNSVNAIVEQALTKVESAARQYNETQNDIEDLWSFLNKQLVNLAIDEAKAMVDIRDELLSFAESFHVKSVDTKENREGLHKAASKIGEDNSTNVLLIISMIEITAYVIFFLYKRYTTENFKKYD